jgi:membrane-bound metal-dependent hydrolase YbcI (DUF457 family)
MFFTVSITCKALHFTMASNKAHHVTGWAAGVIAAALVAKADAGGTYHMWSILALVAGIAGGTAPDWLEVAWWSRRHRLWITHRTWTHWGLAWIALLTYSYQALGQLPFAPLLFGFAAGGIMHLLADWPNPMGVPWIVGRHSLNLWKSGNCDFFVIGAAWIAAFVITDHVFFNNVHTHKIVILVKSIPMWS